MMKICGSGLVVVALAMAMGCGADSSTLQSLDISGPGGDTAELDSGDAGTDAPLPDGFVCRPGETNCMGSVFLVCNVDGLDWMSITCPNGQACTSTGCKGVPGGDVVVGEDVPVEDTSVPGEDMFQPPMDTVGPADVAVDVPVVEDLVVPVDPGVTTDEGSVPLNCGNNPPCPADQVCCSSMMGQRCTAPDECRGTIACQSAQDCSNNQQCCPGQYGQPAQCAATCSGGGTVPTCEATADCSGGQTCVSLLGLTKLCLSECVADTDCGGQTCQDVGAFGYSLAKVCNCAQDTDCGSPLVCCTIQYVDVKTCMTQCM